MTALASPPSSLAAFTSRLSAFREKIVPVMLRAIPEREPQKYLYQPVLNQLSREGKGLRPAICLATCGAFGGDDARALPSAAAIELLHNALLVHDDIEDGSEYRRGHPTLYKEYGVPLAVNIGDAINAMSVGLLRGNIELLGPALAARVFDEFEHMSTETIEGQAMELGWIRDNDCSIEEDDYLLMVLKKTGWYSFIHPARIGALIARPDRDDLATFDRWGYFVGVAFQIQDDVLNLVGDRAKYGKEIGGDLFEGKRTLILAHLFRQSSDRERTRLTAFFARPREARSAREVDWIYERLQAYGSIEYARRAAQTFAAAAREELASAYRGAAEGDDLDFLRSMLAYTVGRDV